MEKKAQRVKFPSLVMTAMIFTMISTQNVLFGKEGAEYGFGVLEFYVAEGLLVTFLWKEIRLIFPAERVKKKRIFSAVSFVLSLAITCIGALLLSWQYIALYQAQKALPESDKDQRTFYILAAICLLIGGAACTYCQITHPVSLK